MEACSRVYLGDLFIFISAPQRGDEVYPTLDVGIPGNSRLNAGKHAVNPIFLGSRTFGQANIHVSSLQVLQEDRRIAPKFVQCFYRIILPASPVSH